MDETIFWIEITKTSVEYKASVCKHFHLNKTCPLTLYKQSNYVQYNTSDVLITSDDGSQLELSSNEFLPSREGIMICAIRAELGRMPFKWVRYFEQIEYILSIILQSVSITAEIVVIVVYLMLFELRNTPGKIVLALTIILLVNDVLVICATYLVTHRMVCKVLAICLHLFGLILYLWTAVLAFDLMQIVLQPFQRQSGNENRLRRYTIFVWLTGISILLVPILLEYLTDFPVDYGSIVQYNVHFCWIRSVNARLIFYIAPSYATLFFSIVVMFIVLLKIRKNNTQQSRISQIRGHSNNRRTTIMAIKLVSAFGVVEIIELAQLSASTEWEMLFQRIIYLLHGITRDVRGLMIFVVYICKQNILKQVLDIANEAGQRMFRIFQHSTTSTMVEGRSKRGNGTRHRKATEEISIEEIAGKTVQIRKIPLDIVEEDVTNVHKNSDEVGSSIIRRLNKSDMNGGEKNKITSVIEYGRENCGFSTL